MLVSGFISDGIVLHIAIYLVYICHEGGQEPPMSA